LKSNVETIRLKTTIKVFFQKHQTPGQQTR